jgi:pyruvate formate lyase activating enzyme
MSTGIVFDIQRFAQRNGPGIRTAVFLKGCPLHCPWCHNPEAQRHDPELAYLVYRCISCGVCSRVCPNHAVKFLTGESHIILRDRCVICGNCVDACVSDALVLTGREMSVEEVMVEARKDVAHYPGSGGGLTISGGEPTQQMDFLVDLLKAAKGEGIHTCVETSGCAPQESFARILPLTDIFLYDYKATGAAYRDLVGVDEALILENLRFLYTSGARVIMRFPLVPGVNDGAEHLDAMAHLERAYPDLAAMHILPYHNTYTSKFERYGYINPLPNQLPAVDSDKARWMKELALRGSQRIIIAP